jgi:hypothetical protein
MKAELEHPINEEFDALTREAEACNPGLLDMLRVFGGYEETVQRMDSYLDLAQPAPQFSISNGTGR